MNDLLLEATDISKAFGGLKALSNVNVSQRRGELLGMIGPNGSGKSTFVNVISGTLKPDSGEILLDGANIARRPQHVVARAGIARTFQAVKIFDKLTVLENVLAGALGHSSMGTKEVDEAREALARVGLTADLEQRAGALGLYDRRRLEFASRLISRPKLLMLDEPVGGLNPEEIRAMIGLIQSLREECGIFIIEHTMKVITSLADRVVVLVNGKKLVDDSPQTVLRHREVIDIYLGTGDA
ncbi:MULTISPECIES: ABC transporter ATP-binding protein [Bradyrhizobium]|uniref:ABC transporter ATP-binding protein n=1 Tax=Bradyrhizobium elkanii TaxID=29448 RepID=UPI00040D8B3C|nr:ABC transporter ATP-binding protein [Bradyrhizobium elkanii]